MRFLATLVIVVLLVIAGGLAFIYSGAYDIAASSEHTGLTHWALDTTMERSVESRAGDVTVPGDLDSRARIEAGASHYTETCQTCHGGPGADPAELAEGLNPKAPDLADEAEEWTPAELFWITKHGVKMTGMPAFGPTHSDEDLWAMVAFVQALPEMSAEEYATLAEAAGGHHQGEDGHGEESAEEPREETEGGHEHEEGEGHDPGGQPSGGSGGEQGPTRTV